MHETAAPASFIVGALLYPEPRDAASCGAALLDQRLPGWHDRSDLTKLDVGRSDCCPLGQLYGDYLKGVLALFNGILASECVTLGFAGMNYPALNEAWRDEIVARRWPSPAPRVPDREAVAA